MTQHRFHPAVHGPLVLLFSSILLLSVHANQGNDLREQIQFAKSQVYPALVNISVVTKRYSGGRSKRRMGGGSGVIVSPNGHVITNYHVATDAVRLECTLPDGETIQADVVGHDPLTDLSVLQLRMDERDDSNGPLEYATFGNSSDLKVGDYVLAIGNPLFLSSSTTLGIVSNPNRVFTDTTGSDIEQQQLREGEKTGLFTRWIQHDALILPGNSGGPLVNLDGEVVGINELGGNGVGFAIPSNLTSTVLNKMLTDGEIIRGWTGLKVLPVSKLGRDTGALVDSIRPSSPAKRSDLKPGDILLSINGEDVNVQRFAQVPLLYQQIASISPGTTVPVTYERDGEEKSTKITTERLQDFLGKQREFRSLGITVRDITEPMAISRRFPDRNGVIVTGIRPGGMADQAEPSLESDDVLLQMEDRDIESLDTLETYLSEEDAFQQLPVRFRRDRKEMMTVLERQDDESISGGQIGKPWIGIETQVITPSVARTLGNEDLSGFRVTRVYDGTKAVDAGLQAGDLIVQFNEDPLTASEKQDANQLTRRIENRMIGDTVTLTVIRGDKTKKIDVKLQETPTTATDADTFEDTFLEFKARGITHMDRLEKNWSDDLEGVFVTNVKSGGWASLGGLKAEDVIQRVDGSRIKSVEDLEQILSRVKKNQPERIRIFVKRGVQTHFVFIEPEWETFSGLNDENQ